MQSPHDTLFHFTFRHPVHAASWLRSALPSELRDAIDWSTLALLDERLPGLQLQPHLADRVFVAALLDGAGQLMILAEHKSHPDPEVDTQVLRYAVLLRHAFQQRLGETPLVLAVLLQHGRRAEPHALPDARKRFRQWQPSLKMVVDDLSRGDEATLCRDGLTPLTALTLLCLQFLPRIAPEEVPTAFERWQDLLRAVDRADTPPLTPPMGRDAIDAIGWYALAVTEAAPETLSETLSRLLHRPEESIMSTLERTYLKGKAEGEAKGEARGEAMGRAETLLRMLHKRFGPLDSTTEQRVRSGSLPELDAWTDRILDAPTLVAVLDG